MQHSHTRHTRAIYLIMMKIHDFHENTCPIYSEQIYEKYSANCRSIKLRTINDQTLRFDHRMISKVWKKACHTIYQTVEDINKNIL